MDIKEQLNLVNSTKVKQIVNVQPSKGFVSGATCQLRGKTNLPFLLPERGDQEGGQSWR
jgi:hypothetical protein